MTRERDRPQRRNYKAQVFKILDPDKTEVRFNSEWLRAAAFEDMIRLCSTLHGGAHSRARRFLQALKEGAPISVHELLYPLVAGLRFGGAAMRRRDGRHRSEIQSAGGPRASRRTTASRRRSWHDRAAARRARRREEDVEVAGQLHRHHRAARGDVPQGDADLRRADVPVLRVCSRI